MSESKSERVVFYSINDMMEPGHLKRGEAIMNSKNDKKNKKSKLHFTTLSVMLF